MVKYEPPCLVDNVQAVHNRPFLLRHDPLELIDVALPLARCLDQQQVTRTNSVLGLLQIRSELPSH